MGKFCILRDILEIKESHLSVSITTNQWVPWVIQTDLLLPPKLHLSFGTPVMTSSLFYLGARKLVDSNALDAPHLPLHTAASHLG